MSPTATIEFWSIILNKLLLLPKSSVLSVIPNPPYKYTVFPLTITELKIVVYKLESISNPKNVFQSTTFDASPTRVFAFIISSNVSSNILGLVVVVVVVIGWL